MTKIRTIGLERPDDNLFSVSVVIPAFNEEMNLKKAVSRVIEAGKKFGLDMELIVVNDGSVDGTPDIADELACKSDCIKVIHNKRNMGIGSSFLSGAKTAIKENVVMIPGDGENNPEHILRYIPLMSMVDIVVPFVSNVEVRSKTRRIVSSFFRFIVNMSFGTSLNYTNGTVLYKRYVLQNIRCKTNGFFYQTELLIRAIRRGYLYGEMPVTLKGRSSGTSGALSWRNLFNVGRAYCFLLFDIHIRRQEGPLGNPLKH